MSSATASVSKTNASANPQASGRAIERTIRFGNVSRDDQDAWLKLDLSDLPLPKVDDLRVDGLKPSWFARLLGRR